MPAFFGKTEAHWKDKLEAIPGVRREMELRRGLLAKSTAPSGRGSESDASAPVRGGRC